MKARQRKRWQDLSIQRERRIVAFYVKGNNAEPDGSFVMNMVLRAYEAGKREGKKASA